MRLILLGCLLIGLAACAGTSENQGQSVPPQPSAAIVDDSTLLVLTAEPPEPLIAKTQAAGYRLVRIDRLDALSEVMVHLRIPDGLTIPEAIEQVESLQPGVTAGANHAYRLQSSTAPETFANVALGWPVDGCAAYQSVGMIDSGVLPQHPKLASGRIIQANLHAAAMPPATTHGSLMADLLVGAGRLTNGKVFSANVIDPRSRDGNTAGVDAILRAVNWLKAEDVALINISLAGPFNKLMNRAMSAAAADGMVFVAAAGNLGSDAPPQYPAAFPYVLAVTAVDQNLEVFRDAVRGDHIDIAAPGVDIIVKSGGKMRAVTGTSVAAALVTAVLAADDKAEQTTIQTARARLAQSAEDLGQPGADPVFGAGLVKTPKSCKT